MPTAVLSTILWIGLGLLLVGSVYLIIEGYRVHKLFTNSIIGKLVQTLVVVVLVELYSLGVISYAMLSLSPRGIIVLIPIVGLWIMCIVYSIYSIHSTRKEVAGLVT
jgi:hypothetical protein